MRFNCRLFKYRFAYHDGWLEVFRQLPKSDRDNLISSHLKALEKNPNDTMTRLMFANNLRLNGQIEKARAEYRKIVEAKDPNCSYTAEKVLREFEGVSDHAPTATYQLCKHFCLKLRNRTS
jgi:hypothetical protein